MQKLFPAVFTGQTEFGANSHADPKRQAMSQSGGGGPLAKISAGQTFQEGRF
jgi:hypothetical protein